MPFISSGRRDLNPGPPIKPPIPPIDGCSIQGNYLPTAPKAVSYGNRVLRVLLGIGGGLQITNDDDASSLIRLSQQREAKGRRVREQVGLPQLD